MEQIYIVMLVSLALLASIDLMVGVANDAVNFLNSGIGSKAVSFKTLMIVASIGITLGSLFSSGMMEIAKSGIFTPSMFTFNDVMIIFLAVMITDVLLLDIFNSLGLPTSTTVSIVFSLLGGAVCLGSFKLLTDPNVTGSILQFINQKKATEIVSSILLSELPFMLTLTFQTKLSPKLPLPATMIPRPSLSSPVPHVPWDYSSSKNCYHEQKVES